MRDFGLRCFQLGTALLIAVGFVLFVPVANADFDDEPAKPKCKKGFYYSKNLKKCVRACKRGWVYSSRYKKCVRRSSEILTDDDLFDKAYALLMSEQYQDGLDLLWRVKDQNTPRVLNYIGYATRKSGDIDGGIKYYKKALALNPKYVAAREYLGEGYLQKGNLQGAVGQLEKIKTACGTTCQSYQTLALEISRFKSVKSF